jgi:hypothetical protein
MDKLVVVALAELERLLYGGNYEVAFRAIAHPAIPGATAREHLQAIFGADAVGFTDQLPVSGPYAISQIEKRLRHAGDDGYGPKKGVFRSRGFKQALGYFKNHLERLSAEATSVVSFRPPPAFPIESVYWEFAYLFVTPQRAEVFIGASSD